MRIMTFNLLFDNGEEGFFAWEKRRDVAVEIILRYRPHILGTQEGMAHQLAFLAEQLSPVYAMVAPGRRWDEVSQYPTIFYRKGDFDLLQEGEFWLSETPQVHLSKSWDSGFPRMMNYGLLRDKGLKREIIALVTHLDHISDEARLEQAKMIGAWLSFRSAPAVLMGDFNDRPDSPVHRVLTRDYRTTRDTWQELSREENETTMTRHDGTGNPKKYRMDWVLHSPEFTVREAMVLRDNRDGLYPSDHYPYLADLVWTDELP